MANVITTLLKLDGAQFKSAMKQVQDQVRQTDGVVNKAKVGFSGLFSSFASSPTVIAGASAAVGAFAVSAVNAASDLNESINAVNVTFGESADKILEFGDNAARSVGLAKSEFNELATPLGSILKNAGFAIDDVADKTIVLTQRAADMASVFNTDVSDALGAIQAGLRGEQDPLEKFGVSLSAAKVEARALADTGKDTAKQLTDQEKQLARVEIILDQTNQTAGDFANTSDGLANQTRMLKAEFQNLQAAAGQELIPVLEDLAGSLLTIEQQAKDAGKAIGDIPGVPEFLKTAARFSVVGQQITFYQKLGDAIRFARDSWGGAGDAVRDLGDKAANAGPKVDLVASAIGGAGEAATAAGSAAGTAAEKITALEQAVRDGGDAWGGYMGAVADATSAVGGAHGDYLQMKDDLEAINQEARDNALNELADAAKAVGEAVSEAFDGVRDSLDMQDLLDDITDQFAEVAEAQDKMAEDGEEGIRNYNRSVRDLQRQLLTLLEDIHSIPPDKKVAIAAEIQRGGIDELFAILAELSKGVIVPATITPQTSPAFSSVQGVFSQSAIPSGPIFQGVTQPPATVDQRTINFYYPVGTTPTTQYQNGILDRLRNGERTSL